MSMDFEIGRTMAEELPFVPLYDYNKLLNGEYNEEDFHKQYMKYKNISIKDFPKVFKKQFKEYEAYYKKLG